MSERRGRIALIVWVLLAVVTAGGEQARAHGGSHSFESVVEGIAPAELADGIEVRVLDSDEQLELVNRSGRAVIVEGYDGEPYARVESAGPVYLNVRSPALHVNNDRWGATEPSRAADASAPPEWVQVGDGGRLAWFDRRIQYREQGTPAAVADPSARTKLWSYEVPITVGDRPAAIRGTLYWTGRKPFPTELLVVVLVVTGGGALLGAWMLKRLRRTERSRPQHSG